MSGYYPEEKKSPLTISSFTKDFKHTCETYRILEQRILEASKHPYLEDYIKQKINISAPATTPQEAKRVFTLLEKEINEHRYNLINLNHLSTFIRSLYSGNPLNQTQKTQLEDLIQHHKQIMSPCYLPSSTIIDEAFAAIRDKNLKEVFAVMEGLIDRYGHSRHNLKILNNAWHSVHATYSQLIKRAESFDPSAHQYLSLKLKNLLAKHETTPAKTMHFSSSSSTSSTTLVVNSLLANSTSSPVSPPEIKPASLPAGIVESKKIPDKKSSYTGKSLIAGIKAILITTKPYIKDDYTPKLQALKLVKFKISDITDIPSLKWCVGYLKEDNEVTSALISPGERSEGSILFEIEKLITRRIQALDLNSIELENDIRYKLATLLQADLKTKTTSPRLLTTDFFNLCEHFLHIRLAVETAFENGIDVTVVREALSDSRHWRNEEVIDRLMSPYKNPSMSP